MLNHARTLLLNRSGDIAQNNAFFGEEAVPAEFKELNLPTFLDDIRRHLFGSDPDRAMLNYRIWQFMQLIHATELEQFVLDLDSRVTYVDSRRTDMFEPETFTPAITPIGGTPEELFIQGGPAVPDTRGRAQHQYRIRVLSGTTVEVKQQTPPVGQEIFTYTLVDGVSDVHPLGDSGYSFMLSTGNSGSEWRVDIINRPQFDLGQIAAALDSIGEPALLQLFGTSPQEPFLTFRNLWFTNKELPFRLGGLVLALVYRTEEVRSIARV
jgi:hypothetical protein